MKRNVNLLAALLLVAFAIGMAEAADYKLIVHSGVGVTTLNAAAVEKIFLGKKSKWDDGTKIVPVTLAKDSAIHKAFVAEVVKKAEPKFTSFWQQALFTGKGTPPKSFGSEAELVKFVASTKGAVGYVAAGTAVDGAKEVKIEN